MRTRRYYLPGKGLIEERVPSSEMRRRAPRVGLRGRRGDFWFNAERTRLEAHGKAGHLVGMELPKGN